MKNKCHKGSSNFSFPHNVFHSYISLVPQTAALCGNGFNSMFEVIVLAFQVFLSAARGSCLPQWYSVLTHNQGVLVSSLTGSSGSIVGLYSGKTLQSPSLVLVNPRKDRNKVGCHHDMTEILMKVGSKAILSIQPIQQLDKDFKSKIFPNLTLILLRNEQIMVISEICVTFPWQQQH